MTTQYKHVNYLWDDVAAAQLDPVGRLVYRSNILGADQRITNTALKVAGLFGQLDPSRKPDGEKPSATSRYAPNKGRFARTYLQAVASTIAGGTSEINRNIIASRGLGLPRD